MPQSSHEILPNWDRDPATRDDGCTALFSQPKSEIEGDIIQSNLTLNDRSVLCITLCRSSAQGLNRSGIRTPRILQDKRLRVHVLMASEMICTQPAKSARIKHFEAL